MGRLFVVSTVNNRINLRHLQRTQASVTGYGILHGAVQVGIGTVNIAPFIEQASQFVKGSILTHGTLQVPKSSTGQVINLAGSVALSHIGFVHGVIQIGLYFRLFCLTKQMRKNTYGLIGMAIQSRLLGADDVAIQRTWSSHVNGVPIKAGLLQVLTFHTVLDGIVGQPAITGSARMVISHTQGRIQTSGVHLLQQMERIRIEPHHAQDGGTVDSHFLSQLRMSGDGQQGGTTIEVMDCRVGLVVLVFIRQFLAKAILLKCVGDKGEPSAQVGDASLLAGMKLLLAGNRIVQLVQHVTDRIGGQRGGLHGRHDGQEKKNQGQYKDCYHGFTGFYRVLQKCSAKADTPVLHESRFVSRSECVSSCGSKCRSFLRDDQKSKCDLKRKYL